MYPVNTLINSILIYSPIKHPENENPEYSVLKPDTNSDSPSEKSKGVRLDSANMLGSHIPNTGTNKKNILSMLINS